MRRSWIAVALALVVVAVTVALVVRGRGTRREIPVPAGLATSVAPAAPLMRDTLARVRGARRDPSAWYALGLAYEANDEPALAREAFAGCLDLDGDRARAWYHLAVLHDHFGESARAIEAMRHAIDLDGTYAPAWWRLGGWLLDGDEVDTAQDAFAKATSLAPGDPEGAVGLARVDLRRGNAEAAIERLTPLVAGPARNHPLANQLLATALVRVGRGDEAEAAFARARRGGAAPVDVWLADANPYRADLEAQLDAAKGLAMNGRFGEAITRLEMLGRAHPDNATIRVNLAVVHRARGDLPTSVSILEEAIVTFPESAPARYNLALSRFLEARRPDGSFDVSRFGPVMVQLDAAIASNPSYAPAHGLYGDVNTARGAFAEAVASFERATVADPANPLWRMQLGLAEMRDGKPGRAVEILQALVDEAPQAPDAMRALAQALAADGRATEAASAFARAEQLAAERRPGGRP